MVKFLVMIYDLHKKEADYLRNVLRKWGKQGVKEGVIG